MRRANEAFNSRDWETWAGFIHPEVVYYDRSYLDTPPVIKGRKQLREAAESFMEGIDDLRVEMETTDAGEQVFCVTTWTGSGRSTGARTKYREFIVYAFSEGMIAEGRVFSDRAEALKAAGLSE